MPIMDGFQTSQTIIQMKHEGKIPDDLPVIALTANAMEGDREKCLQAGMNDYLSKPVRAKALRDKVHQWIGNRHRENEVLLNSDDISTLKEHDYPVIDKDINDDARTILKEKYEEMAHFFIEDAHAYLHEIRQAAAENSFENAIRPAHTIKSSAQTMGAMALSHYAKMLEYYLKSLEETEFMSIKSERVNCIIDRIEASLNATEPFFLAKSGESKRRGTSA